ncbi:hypothetical protein OHB26_19670 [Nocardia sp. NBC_01503]|uniref:hypothetical protein n=1 Tax=Nocardia sp. NBC_01503 TaxID=2975997 RepID=UPI002E7BF2D3|nr:hypothetical protein [Nocardia sp. NBC_01503]WTL29235.1 hypothetical protein OHB26_19670 [Nocardia sp. NBC_01503]
MEIIVVATLIALVLVFLAAHALPDAERTRRPKRLTVADIQARLAAEPPRPYVPISRGR